MTRRQSVPGSTIAGEERDISSNIISTSTLLGSTSVLQIPPPSMSLSSPIPSRRKRALNSTPRSCFKKAASLENGPEKTVAVDKSLVSFGEDNLCPVCDDTCTCGSSAAISLNHTLNMATEISMSSKTGVGIVIYPSTDSDDLSGYDSDINNEDDAEEEYLLTVRKLRTSNMTEEDRVLSALACAEDPFEKIDHFLYSSTVSEEDDDDLRKYCSTAPPSVFQYRPSVYSYESESGILSGPRSSRGLSNEEKGIDVNINVQPAIFYNSSPENDFPGNIPMSSCLNESMTSSADMSRDVDKTVYVKTLSSVDKATLLEALKIMAPDVVESMKTKKKKAPKMKFPNEESPFEIIDNNAKPQSSKLDTSFKTSPLGSLLPPQDPMYSSFPLTRHQGMPQRTIKATSAFKNNLDPWISSGTLQKFDKKARKASLRKKMSLRKQSSKESLRKGLTDSKRNLPADLPLPLYFEEVVDWCNFDNDSTGEEGLRKFYAINSHTNGYWEDSSSGDDENYSNGPVGSEPREWMYATLFDDLVEYGDEFWYFDTLVKNESSGGSSDVEMYHGAHSLSVSSSDEDRGRPHKKPAPQSLTTH